MSINEALVKNAKEFLLDLLPRAGQILRRYFGAEELVSKRKGIHDFVTAADLAVDKFLQEKLVKAFPKIPILTEEAVKGEIDLYRSKSPLWIIDPLDGTANFSRGDSNFSISVALVDKGKTVLGAIFAPVTSRLFWASILEDHAYWN